MSFFDEDDEPRRSQRTRPRPRRSSAAGGVAADSQTLLIRRIVAGGAFVVVLLLLAVAINSCRTSQQRNGLKDYNRQVATLGGDSSQLGSQFFKLFDQGAGQSPQDLQTAISGYRVEAERQLQQARNLNTPGDMAAAQQSLLISFELRRDGLDFIAQRIRTALGDSGEAADAAIRQIAGQMQAFNASDVIYEARVIPFIKRALDAHEVGGQQIARSRFLPDVAWMSPQFVATKLDQQLSSGTGTGRSGQPTGPGLHGTGLTSTAFGGTTLQPSTSNRLTYQPGQAFTVTFANQGENDEFDVKVTVRITGSGQPITLTKTVSKVAKGQTATANLALERTPPLGAAVTIQVTVGAVPGEQKTDNNKASYPALFSRG